MVANKSCSLECALHVIVHFIAGCDLPDSITVHRRGRCLKFYWHPWGDYAVAIVEEIPKYLVASGVATRRFWTPCNPEYLAVSGSRLDIHQTLMVKPYAKHS